MTEMSAKEMIAALDLAPHPEGGHFRETFRDTRDIGGGRAASTAIYYLLAEGEVSHWHRVDAVEVWHWYAGAPLRLSRSTDGRAITHVRLGPDIAAGEAPQVVVPAHEWQGARSLGAWTLVGCTVAPGFQFEGFELAPEGFGPPVVIPPR